MTRALGLAFCWCVIVGAGCSPASPVNSQPALSAALARDALLDLLRREPDLFIGRPVPERLAQLPLQDNRDGTYAWGAFVLNPATRVYFAEIGNDSPEPYHYSGTFEWRGKRWVATQPQVQRFHQPVSKGSF